MKSYVLVINLKSRRASMALKRVKKEFAKKKTRIKIIEVNDPSHLTAAFQKAIDLKPSVVVLGGGDGTLISGIEYLTKKNYRNNIGLLPLGTANYLARNLSIPLGISRSISNLLKGDVREIPVGTANGKYFALTFIVGLTQAVSENVSDDLKKKIGQVAYLVELFKQAKQHEPFAYRIESPELKRAMSGTSHQILVYNSDINQQLKLVPAHQLEKPTLKVVISDSGTSKAKLFIGFLVHIVTLGRKRPFMRVFEARSLKITTDPVLPGDFDGEPYSKSPFEVQISPRKARIIC
jgi:YegS/Rv2252/BmrU family lipid kinase